MVTTDDRVRCPWATTVPEFAPYHDDEWGYPVDDDIRLFEKMSLESFQSGLSWRTILNKRESFRAAFDGFDFALVADYDDRDVEQLLNDASIVRHRGKIEAVINNAAVVLDICESHGSLAAFVWRFEPDVHTPGESTSAESKALSKELKSRGWKFFGPTTAYAFMQAMGLVNDHSADCFCRPLALTARERFTVPVAR